MTNQEQLKIDILVRLDGASDIADTLRDLLKRQKVSDIVQEAMIVLARHGLVAAKLSPTDDDGLCLAVQGENGKWLTVENAYNDLRIDLRSWNNKSGRLKEFWGDSWASLVGKEMHLKDRQPWLDIAFGNDLMEPVRQQREASNRAERAIRAPTGNNKNPGRTRSRP